MRAFKSHTTMEKCIRMLKKARHKDREVKTTRPDEVILKSEAGNWLANLKKIRQLPVKTMFQRSQAMSQLKMQESKSKLLRPNGSDSEITFVAIEAQAKLQGAIETPGDVVIDGTFEGKINAKNLIVTATGRVIGCTNVETAQIAGYIELELNCSGQLSVLESGTVKGKIRYGHLSVALGGKCLGEVEDYPEKEMKTENITSLIRV